MLQGTALVTGGAGFVGRNVVRRLLCEGMRVWIVDNLSTGAHPDAWLAPEQRKQVIFLHDDVRHVFQQDAQNAVRQHALPHFDYVFHFAAVVGGRVRIDGDPLSVAQDLSIDAELYMWAVQKKPGKMLYASSSAAYPVSLQGEKEAVALKESDIVFGGDLGQPDMTYGWSKLTGEYLARIAAAHYGLHVACVRPFSGYGEDQDASYPIPAIAARAVKRENPFDVWGSGDQGRDFVHIDDCVDAMLLAIEHYSDGSAVNIGAGKLTSFKEIIRLFASIAGYDPVIRPLRDKPVGVHTRYADMTKAKQELHWEPKVSLKDGLRRVYDAVSRHERVAVPA